MASRRTIILGLGGAVALVGAGATWRVMRVPQTAMRPWQVAEPVADVRLDALRHAILAPNPHNRQPWLLTLTEGNGVDVRCDPDRRLPATDPHDRQILIGFGAFCELARVAASTRGHRLDIIAFPDGLPGDRLDDRVIARLQFVADPAIARDPLAAVITARRTTRQPFADRPVPTALLQRCAAIAVPGVTIAHSNDPVRLAAIRETTLKAFTIEAETPRTWQESVDLLRIGADAIDAHPDGLFLQGPMVEALALAGVLDADSLADRHSTVFRQGLDEQLAIIGSLPAAIWLTTPGNDRPDQFAAGQAWLRLNLLATALGLKLHPNSQALQEYPEMTACFARLHEQLGARGDERVQMFGRIGYGPATGPAPRWPLESHFRP
ncbi:MAG: twin-arginine translocation pathway signal protein [Alphaproteobacteria bacterium PA4]|nr:MAG: twin-arginine translocation pathway signal protein [Alphaproteobacteria bacterium PA4]